MIRVLHSVSNMDRAGLETMLMNYYRHIDREKVQFDFLCNKTKPGAYDDEIRSLGGRIFHAPGLNPVKYFKYLKYMKELFAEHPEYQIVEAHNGAMGVYALYAAKRNGIRNRICHAHETMLPRDWKLPLKIVCKALMPWGMNLHYTCGEAAARFYFGKKTVDAGNYELIPNAIEVERFTFDEHIRAKIRQENGLSDKVVIGHVGRFVEVKNHHFLLDVFASVVKREPRAHLLLIGDGELRGAIKAKIERLGLSNAVTFTGNIPNVNEWYQAMDCFILPSKREGLPVVGVEAQAADLPCVFSDTITQEIRLTDKATFVSLKKGSGEWAEIVLNMIRFSQRKNQSALMTEKNYNIRTEAVKLQERYLKLAGQ